MLTSSQRTKLGSLRIWRQSVKKASRGERAKGETMETTTRRSTIALRGIGGAGTGSGGGHDDAVDLIAETRTAPRPPPGTRRRTTTVVAAILSLAIPGLLIDEALALSPMIVNPPPGPSLSLLAGGAFSAGRQTDDAGTLGLSGTGTAPSRADHAGRRGRRVVIARSPLRMIASAAGPPPSSMGAGGRPLGDDRGAAGDDDASVKGANAAMNKRTLYDVLGTTRDATPSELKRRYVALAKLSHPDAKIGTDGAGGGPSTTGEGSAGGGVIVDFAEIASAYEVLSDPRRRKRYDRSLLAESFTRDVERAASDFGRVAGPRLADLFEQVAIPTIRRTAVTTAAVVGAVATNATASSPRDANGGGGVDLGMVVESAIRAGRSAGRDVDRMELLEKSEDLERRGGEELERASELSRRADILAERRLDLSLRTPNSAMPSHDASAILDALTAAAGGEEETLSTFDRVFARRTARDHVEALKGMEIEYDVGVREAKVAETETERMRTEVEEAEARLREAVEAEIRAREVLEQAQRTLADAEGVLVERAKHLTLWEDTRRRTAGETEKLAESLSRQQERVRLALLKKRERSAFGRDGGDDGAGEGSDGVDEGACDEMEPSLETLESLKREENGLRAESERMHGVVKRMQSRAEKLKQNADALLNDQQA